MGGDAGSGVRTSLASFHVKRCPESPRPGPRSSRRDETSHCVAPGRLGGRDPFGRSETRSAACTTTACRSTRWRGTLIAASTMLAVSSVRHGGVVDSVARHMAVEVVPGGEPYAPVTHGSPRGAGNQLGLRVGGPAEVKRRLRQHLRAARPGPRLFASRGLRPDPSGPAGGPALVHRFT